MKVFSTEQIRLIDEYTIKNEPIESINLMERAASTCCKWIIDYFDKDTKFIFFAGPGNNGGDAWALARLLINSEYKNIKFYYLYSEKISKDAEINKQRLEQLNSIEINSIKSENEFPVLSENSIVIDGLFGTGLNRPLEGLSASLVNYINKHNCKVISIDMPGGLFGEDNSNNNKETIIKATWTLSFQFPKLSFFFAENEDFVGKWYILPIGLNKKIIEELETNYYYIEKEDIKNIIKKRKTFSHKGTFGHALLIAGSYGMSGAAILSSTSCLRAGAGLVTVHTPKANRTIIQTAIPEVILSIDKSTKNFSSLPELSKYDAIGIGPGIGINIKTKKAFKKIISKAKKPLILDADALNIVSLNSELLNKLPINSILTPHPGEFDRLTKKHFSGYERHKTQLQLSTKHSLHIILKGAYTSIATPDGKCFFNSTGNPGMATAGSGDVLTGIILGFLSQKYSPLESALSGVFIHGLAGDLTITEQSYESLIASDIIKNLGKAFKEIINYKS